MSHVAKPHGYWSFRNDRNEGVYIVTSPTHYPLLSFDGYIRHEGILLHPHYHLVNGGEHG